jgi:UDP-glucose 4-epimerase
VKLLVTGGAGYIGSVVAAVLIERGHQVTVLDDLSTGHADAVPAGTTFVEGSIFDSAALLAQGFDAVLHFAAKSLVAESVAHPELYWHNNVAGSLALLEAMRQAGVERIVFSSTAAVYGQPESVPITSEAATRPTNPYGASKLAVDHMLDSYAQAYGVRAISLRYFNVAGAHGPTGERHRVETHLIPNALRAAGGSGAVLSVFGRDYPTPDGTAVRDYIHVTDLADAHLRALDALDTPELAGRHRIFNLGTGTGSSVLDIVATIAEVTGQTVPTVDEPRRAGDPAVLVADGSGARTELGWRPTRTLADMIADAWRFERGQLKTPGGSPAP